MGAYSKAAYEAWPVGDLSARPYFMNSYNLLSGLVMQNLELWQAI
jgi:hypothetical protein